MFDIGTLLIVIPGLPLAAALLTALLGQRVLRERSHVPTITAVALSCMASLILMVQVGREVGRATGQEGTSQRIGYERVVTLCSWAAVPRAYPLARTAPPPAAYPPEAGPRDFRVDIALRADPLSAVMAFSTTFILLLAALYSVGSAEGQPGCQRFFALTSLLAFSMTMLFLASNLVMFVAFWLLVGFCNLLLVGSRSEQPKAAADGGTPLTIAGVADVGILVAALLLWTSFGTLDFHDSAGGTPGLFGQTMLGRPDLYGLYMYGGVGTAVCLLLLLAACSRSAQLPLHGWIVDAMAARAPTGVVVHVAATTTAGVYLLARCTPLLAASPNAQCVLAAVGGATALVTALAALAQTDLRRILAYATIGQLGTAFVGLGVGTAASIAAGVLHLVISALVIALLLLAAADVMRTSGGCGDVSLLGGLKQRLPVARWTFLIGCLTLCGVPPLSVFFSKGMILAALTQRAAAAESGWLFDLLYDATVLTAFLTALYTLRMYFLTFRGEETAPAEEDQHGSQSSRHVTVPLVALAMGAGAVGGTVWLRATVWPPYGLAAFLAATPSLASVGTHSVQPAWDWRIAGALAAMVFGGIGLAAILYTGNRTLLHGLTRVAEAAGLRRFCREEFFVAKVCTLAVVRPLQGLARAGDWIDRTVIDRLVDACGRVPVLMGTVLRPLQNGLIPFYALATVMGLLVLLGALLM